MKTSMGNQVDSVRFAKVESVGNHFVLVTAFDMPEHDWVRLAQLTAPHRFGIGSDGLLVISPSAHADFKFRMFNTDGSEDMCGNGLRCAALYVVKKELVPKCSLLFETKEGFREAVVLERREFGGKVKANMGKPSLKAEDVPMHADVDLVIDHPLSLMGETFELTCVTVGTPHAVIRADLEDFWHEVPEVSAEIERHPLFPERVNVTWYSPAEGGTLFVRTWERGVGPTLGCGTGACAALVAAHIHGLSERTAAVRFPGGELTVEWLENGDVWVNGSARVVFEGVMGGV